MTSDEEISYKLSGLFWRKDDYEGNTKKENHDTDDSWSDNKYFVKILDKEQEYKNIINTKNILLSSIKQTNLRWVNLM